jgi:hypothetical protein
MASLHRAVAGLNIVGEDLDPSEVARLLGGAPSYSYSKGDDIRRRPDMPERLARRGLWSRKATPTEPENLDAQVLELLSGLTENLAVWGELSAKYRIAVFCGWFMRESNEGVEISPNTLRLLGERGIVLSLDIYGPDDAA